MFAAKNARADTMYQPQLFPEPPLADDDSEATIITDNTSSKQNVKETSSEQGETTIPGSEDNVQALPISNNEPELRKNREPQDIVELKSNYLIMR